MYEERDDATLLEIVRSDDYTPEARSAAYRLLVDRGFDDAAIAETPLDPIPPRDQHILSIRTRSRDGRSAAQIIAAAKRRCWLYRATATMAVTAIPLLVIALVYNDNDLRRFAFGLVYVHVAIHSLTWLRPTRLLVLRPFHTADQRHGLERIIRRRLCFFGHVYTLQDSTFPGNESDLPGRGSWLWGSPRRFFAFDTTVRFENDLGDLQNVMMRKFKRNINWAVSINHVFAVACAQQYWRQTVQLLINMCDVIIIDASVPRHSLMWEATEIAHYELNIRSIVITSNDERVAGEVANLCGNCPVFRYDRRSGQIQDLGRFLDAVAGCIAS